MYHGKGMARVNKKNWEVFNQFVFQTAGPENNRPGENNDEWETVLEKFRQLL